MKLPHKYACLLALLVFLGLSCLGHGWFGISDDWDEVEVERAAVAGICLYDFGPRALYSPAAQFISLDPKCEDYPHLSPYLYCAANPANFPNNPAMNARFQNIPTINVNYNGLIKSVKRLR